jgi:transposase-like protein
VTSGELPGRHFSAEEKIRIVLDGLRGEDNIAALCRKEGIAQDLYYRWSKEFLEACKKRPAERGQVDFRAMKRDYG